MVNEKSPIEIVEEIIQRDEKLKVRYSTGKKLRHFKIGDVVYCTLLKGLFKVVDINAKPKCLSLSNIELIQDNIFILPEFVDKVNKDTVKVLYNV